MSLTAIEFIYFEEPPFSRTEPGCIADQYHDLPEPYREALGVIGEQVDSLLCARCGDIVGFVLEGDRDEYTKWECLSLARRGDGPIAMLCEICTPWVPDPDTSPAAL